MPIPTFCPLCNACSSSQSVVTNHVYGSVKKSYRAFFHCNECDVRYQFPRLTPEEENRFYVAEFEAYMDGRAGVSGGWHSAESHIIANENTRMRRMIYLEPHLGKGSRILEIGCSSGFMIHPLIEAGHDCVGVEPSGVFSDFLKKKGLVVYPDIQKLRKERSLKKFDLILHFFVLEHIQEPLTFLREQLGILKKGGKLIFEIPNAADPLYSIFDIAEFERFYWSVAHPWYFSEASLKYLLSHLGCEYEVFREQRYDLSNHLIWARDGRPGGMGRFDEHFGDELNQMYKKRLIETGNCDTLVAVLTKT